jgi:predicted RNA binding protein YcfA (HicA-like mRNA interferase family)
MTSHFQIVNQDHGFRETTRSHSNHTCSYTEPVPSVKTGIDVERGLLGCNAFRYCRWIPTFRRNASPVFSLYLENEGSMFLRNAGEHLQGHKRHSSEYHVLYFHRLENLKRRLLKNVWRKRGILQVLKTVWIYMVIIQVAGPCSKAWRRRRYVPRKRWHTAKELQHVTT